MYFLSVVIASFEVHVYCDCDDRVNSTKNKQWFWCFYSLSSLVLIGRSWSFTEATRGSAEAVNPIWYNKWGNSWKNTSFSGLKQWSFTAFPSFSTTHECVQFCGYTSPLSCGSLFLVSCKWLGLHMAQCLFGVAERQYRIGWNKPSLLLFSCTITLSLGHWDRLQDFFCPNK